jgi:hypothetical protein
MSRISFQVSQGSIEQRIADAGQLGRAAIKNLDSFKKGANIELAM